MNDSIKILTSQSNLRSSSGLLQIEGDSRRYHYKRSSPERTSREGEELIRARATVGDIDGVGPVSVKACLADQGLLVTEYLDGAEHLLNWMLNRTRLWRKPLDREQAAGIGCRLGAWLAAYHGTSLAPVDDPAPYLGWIIRDASSKFYAVCKHAPSFIPETTKRALACYFERAGGIALPAEHGHYVAQIHGDMDLVNVHIGTDGRLHLIDFADTRRGLPWEDLARVWHVFRAVASMSTGSRRQSVDAALTGLLNGYGVPPEVVDSPLFVLLRTWNAFARILTFVLMGRRLGVSGYMYARAMSRVNRTWLAQVHVAERS